MVIAIVSLLHDFDLLFFALEIFDVIYGHVVEFECHQRRSVRWHIFVNYIAYYIVYFQFDTKGIGQHLHQFLRSS